MLLNQALIFLSASLFVGGTQAARFKANEYTDEDCQSDLNYPHTDSTEVTMDDTSNSVYLAVSHDDQYIWQAFAGKSGNGGVCEGAVLGNLTTGPGRACNSLNKSFGQRVKCVKYCSIASGGWPACRH
ncbi:hypothetical protein F5Y04DRAFT_280355 [Hypomontagnella monticulosa]|nr:hypothetical protein F5Y04DRAFT_280355 [Hypomontagnella monticulosa]